jgi:hypothetical protein
MERVQRAESSANSYNHAVIVLHYIQGNEQDNDNYHDNCSDHDEPFEYQLSGES